jgi:hypothetical protein
VKGDRRVVALLGESVHGEYFAECGMRKRRGRAKFFLDGCAEAGVGGGRDTVGDRTESLKEKDPLIALAGCEVGGEGFLRGNLGKFTPALTGLKTGVIASRN